jgi:acetate---CoA ligase (ADP-forming) subunit beta
MALAQGRVCPSLSRLVDRVQKAVLDSPAPRQQEIGSFDEEKGGYTVASHPLIERARQQGRTLLTELESKQVLHDLGIPTTLGQLATSEEEAVRAADAIGYPVVLKVASPDIVHKSDVGGVQLHLQDGEAVCQAFRAIQQSVAAHAPGARVDGISVQQMAAPGVEVIVGMSKDVTFGPVLMFGLGGVLVEVLKDVTFRIVPLSKRDASEMIHDIKGFPVLAGYRGAAPADLDALQNILLTLSAFVDSTPEVKEIDLNPIYAYARGALAVDARVVLEEVSASA